MAFKTITFQNLYDYIQDAGVDNVGRHYPFEGVDDWFFHIYSNTPVKRQVNINKNDMPVTAILFNPEEDKVTLVHVSAPGIASYDDASKKCTLPMSAGMWEGNWEGRNNGTVEGKTVKSVILDAITGYVVDKDKQTSAQQSGDKVSVSPVDVAMTYYALNSAVNELNSINDNYIRRAGTLVMACSETEDRIEEVCARIMSSVSTLRQPGYLDCVANRDEISMTLPVVEDVVKANLEEVARSRKFLETYTAR